MKRFDVTIVESLRQRWVHGKREGSDGECSRHALYIYVYYSMTRGIVVCECPGEAEF